MPSIIESMSLASLAMLRGDVKSVQPGASPSSRPAPTQEPSNVPMLFPMPSLQAFSDPVRQGDRDSLVPQYRSIPPTAIPSTNITVVSAGIANANEGGGMGGGTIVVGGGGSSSTITNINNKTEGTPGVPGTPSSTDTKTLAQLTDVLLNSPVSGQALVFNGSVWVNAGINTGSVAPNSVVSLYLENTAFGTGSLLDLFTYASGGLEHIVSGTVTNSTTFIGGYVSSTTLDSTFIPAGTWILNAFVSVNNVIGNNFLIAAMCRRIAGAGTVTITGTGTSRTATVTGGTPFLLADANADQTQASRLETPNGTFQISAFTNDHVITIVTPASYANEAAVAYATHRYLLQIVSSNIDSTTPVLRTGNFVSPQITGLNNTDTLSAFLFARGDNTSTNTRTIFCYHNGSTHPSNIQTPLPLTFVINIFTSALKGLVPASGGGTIHFIRADGTWAQPSADDIFSGYHVAPTLVARDAIPSSYREEGMECYVVATGLLYRLQGGILNANWVEVETHNLLSARHPDTLTDNVIQGDVIVGNATPKWSRLAANATATKKYLQSISSGIPSWQQPNLSELGDVSLTAPASNQLLVFNGSVWVNSPVPPSPSPSVAFFYQDTPYGSGGLFTLLRSPGGGLEVDDSATVGTSTVDSAIIEGYVTTDPIGVTTFPGGEWLFDWWTYVDIVAGSSFVVASMYRRFAGAGTVTITGVGTSRTATVTGGTPFVLADANADIKLAGVLETPTRIFPITGFTSNDIVTINVPNAYVNEVGVAYFVHRWQFNSSTPTISSTTPIEMTVDTVQPAFTGWSLTDKMSVINFAYHPGAGNRTIHFLHNGTVHYSHVHSPLALVHNDLSGLQGGTTNEYYHLTAAQHTGVLALAGGTTGQILIKNSNSDFDYSWGAGGGGAPHNILSATHTDTLVDSVVQGDVIVGNATPKWARLPANATGTKMYLQSQSGGIPGWQQVDYADLSGTVGGHAILSASHTDTLVDSVVDGDVIIGNVTPKWSRLAISVPAAAVRNVLGVDNGETRPSWKTALDSTAPTTIAAGDVAAAGTSLVFAHRDHKHGSPATYPATPHNIFSATHADTTGAASPVDGDIIIANVTPAWSKLAISVPAANVLNVLGVANGETRPSWKSLFDGTVPTTIGIGDTAAAGTSLLAAHRDHQHASPATWTATAHNILSGIHGDTLADSVVQGDILVGNATPKWSRLVANATATKKYLQSVSGGIPSWQQVAQADISGLTTADSPTFTGLTLSGLTQGSVLFAGVGGTISQDSAFFWDTTNHRLSIGNSYAAALAIRPLNIVDSVGVFRIYRISNVASSDASFELITADDTAETNKKYWDFYLSKANDRLTIRRRLPSNFDALSCFNNGYISIGAASNGLVITPATSFHINEFHTLSGNLTDGFSAATTETPKYDQAFTVTRHNYFDLNNPTLTNSAVVTDACVFRFDANAGTHKAVDSGTTKTTPGTVNAWVKININGTIYFVPAYTSKTT